MFGLGFWELCVILLIALLVLGPKKLPDVATTLGKAIRGFRKATQDLQEQLDVDDEVKRPFQELKAALRNEPEPPKPVVAAARTLEEPISPPATEKISAPSVAAAQPASPKADKA